MAKLRESKSQKEFKQHFASLDSSASLFISCEGKKFLKSKDRRPTKRAINWVISRIKYDDSTLRRAIELLIYALPSQAQPPNRVKCRKQMPRTLHNWKFSIERSFNSVLDAICIPVFGYHLTKRNVNEDTLAKEMRTVGRLNDDTFVGKHTWRRLK